jgi:Protein of unknown function (DUF3024)
MSPRSRGRPPGRGRGRQPGRPPWRPEAGPEWTRLPIARLRYTKTTRRWSLYWRDRHARFHAYDLLPPSLHVDDLLREIDSDPAAIFWG